MTRDGIDMGREQGIYRSASLLTHWSPGCLLGPWRPTLSVGYVRSGLDNILMAADSLPTYARSPASDPVDTARQPVGVKGSGLRLGATFGRVIRAADFSGIVTLNVGIATDVVAFGHVSYSGRRAAIPDPGVSIIPRLAVALRWSPRAPVDGSPEAAKPKSRCASLR